MANEEKLGDAVLLLSTDEKELLRGINSARAKATQMQSHFSDTASAINSALATIGVGLSLNAFLQATIAAEHEQALLAAAVKATGAASGFTARQLEAQASSLQALTGQSDEAIMEAERALMRFGNVQNDVFKRGLAAALDMAAATGGTAADAARSLGMALQDPAEGLDRLKRAGVNVTASVRAQIMAMEEQGDVLGAQKLLLNEVEKAYGGAGKAARDTLGGALANLKNVIEDNILEVKGPFLSGLKQAAELMAGAVPMAVRLLSTAFVILQQAVGGAMQFVFLQIDTLIKLLRGDFRGAWESLKGSFEELNPADWAKKGVEAFKAMGIEQQNLAATTAAAAAEAGKAAGQFDVMGARGTAAMEGANAAALKAADSVRNAVRGAIYDTNASYETLVAMSQEASNRAAQAAALATSSAQAGLVSQAESAKRLAEGYARDAERYGQAAIAMQNRMRAASDSLKHTTAANIGAMAASLAQGKIDFAQFVQQVITEIAMLIVKLLVLKALGFGFGGSFATGMLGGLQGARAEGGDVRAGGTYLVGENGPELFTPKGSGDIIPNHELGGGAPVINQSFNIAGLDLGSAEAARKFLQTAAAQMRAGAIEAQGFAQAASDQMTLQPRRAYS